MNSIPRLAFPGPHQPWRLAHRASSCRGQPACCPSPKAAGAGAKQEASLSSVCVRSRPPLSNACLRQGFMSLRLPQTCYIARDDLDLQILLLPRECRDHKCAPPHQAYVVLASLTGFTGRCVLPLELHAQLRLVAVIVVIVY